jgi:hypothetical protein
MTKVRAPEYRLPQIAAVLLVLRLLACSEPREPGPALTGPDGTGGVGGSAGTGGTGGAWVNTSTSGGLPFPRPYDWGGTGGTGGTGGATSGGLPVVDPPPPPDLDADAGS